MKSDVHPIFIIGAPRSGTTLLQYMLKSHPNISFPSGESHFIVPLCKEWDSLGNLTTARDCRSALERMCSINRVFLESDLHGLTFDMDDLQQQLIEHLPMSMPEFIHRFFSMNARGEGKHRWGDKTPYYSLHVPLLSRSFPKAQFIHIIRDGRDCAVSMLGRSIDLQIYNIYDAAYIWDRYVNAAQSQASSLGANRYLAIKYEELLRDPDKTMHSVCDFLNEPFDESVINFNKPKNPTKTPLLGQPVKKENTGKWSSKLSPRQIRSFEGYASETLMRYGYELANVNPQLAKGLELAYRIHSRLLRWYYTSRKTS